MNFKLSSHFIVFLFCVFRTDSYIISESEKSDELLRNSYFDDNQMDRNVVNVDKSVTFSESRTPFENQTISSILQKPNQMSVKKINQKLKSCRNCLKENLQLNAIEEQNIQRLEYIKQQILSKLGMSEAPKLLPKYYPSSNYLQLLEASSISTHGFDPEPRPVPKESDKVFIFPTIRRLNIPQFNVSIAKDSFGVNLIQKITLFVRQRTTTYSDSYFDDNSVDKELTVISTAIPANGVLTRFQDINNMRVLGIVDPQSSDGKPNGMEGQSPSHWLQYDLTQLLRPEVMKANNLVSFDSESFDLKDSFITVEQFNNNIMRSRRSIDCTGNSTSCCRESFYVNFTTIGWDNWIIQPIGYDANYCKGKCDISNARYHHTTVIGKYPAISLCCSPREMSHISLIYLDEKGVVYQKNLANMRVESCDCA